MKCNSAKVKRSLVICCAFFVALSILLIPGLILAAVNTNAHWPVEITLRRRNSVYGAISGLSLEDGDSVGMFDADGNCHGAGLYRGNHYALTAFMREEADPENPGDQTIEGFVEGEEVFFKIYQKSTGKEYTVTHSSGNPYHFRYVGLTPLTKINLLYEEEPTIPPTDPDDTGGGGGDETGDGDGDGGGDGGKTPMGVWALAPEEEGIPIGLGSDSMAGDSDGSGRDSSSDALVADGGYSDVGSGSSPSYRGSSGRSMGSLSRAPKAAKEKKEEIKESNAWKDALRRIEEITGRPFSKRSASGTGEEGPAKPAKEGMPLPLKIFLLFLAPASAVTGIVIKLMRS
jgi:hypothetical protein